MKKIRKYGFLLIAFAILLLVSKVETKAATIVKEGSCGEKATYTLDSDGVLTISGSGEITTCFGDFEAVSYFSYIFESDGLEFISIGEEINKVIIKKGITQIGEHVFACTSLSSISLPDGLKCIKNDAFYQCSMKSITIPSTVTQLEHAAVGFEYGATEKHWTKLPREDFTIYGVKGSAAETYAKENGITFKEVSNKKSTTKKLTSKNTTIKLSKTTYTYNGKAKKPTVKVYNSAGKLLKNKYYSLSYKDNKNPGKATVIIKFKNGYSGTIKKTFTINPASTKISNVAVKLTWAKQKQITGYQIQYATNNKFTKNKKSEIVKGSDKNYLTVKMEKGKTYYYRVRTYKTINGKKYYSSWSKTTSVTVK